MKFVMIMVCLIVGIYAATQKLTDEQKAKIKGYKVECLTSSGVSEDVVKKARHEGIFEDEEKLGKFFACFGKKVGFLSDAGEYQIDVIKTRITAFYNADVAEKVIKECTQKKYGSIEETALNFSKCSYKLKREIEV